MMSVPKDGVDVSRRRLLWGASAAVLLSTPCIARAESLGREPAAPRGNAAGSVAAVTPIVVQPLHREEAADWRQLLLAGERSITMRRGGPTTAVHYGNGDGTLDRDGYLAACYLLRDVRAERMVQIDPHLLDVLCGIQRWMEFHGRSSTIEITSGYRTIKTNDSAEGSGRHSMHLFGKAADIVVPGASSNLIGAMVQRFNNEGGTGIYLGKGFVHVDTGSARTWVTPAAATRRTRRGRRHR